MHSETKTPSSRATEVRLMQGILKRAGYVTSNIAPDGVHRKETLLVIRRFKAALVDPSLMSPRSGDRRDGGLSDTY
ncbi:peptidoglycan-binding protein [Rhizobiaceae bacterium n13]|uniref:Peptidoglycan-binding protein n=1 Tax=Ferirhizobium litorale TaxID=2927786 RepID=A0AAE3QKB9_9HYPH|nr:hypothetical protein [Fererhizobium litorale]MDI7864480.1 peptidoglycan-binding protein [Fererhizobium litorale]MDI7924769.1 peptidoglycan-binding protein [Fererhizobium litorale]